MIDMRRHLCILLLAFVVKANAQNPAPASNQQEAILILNGIAHLGNGRVIQNSAIGFQDGKLTLVGDATVIKIDRNAYPRIIEATGKHIYPGLIECNSTLGLTEIDLVRATRDYGEVGTLNPNVRSLIAYNTDSKIIPTVRSNGVLLAQIVPEGQFVTGQSSVVELDAWNWEDAAYKTDIGIHIIWPRMYVVPNHPKETEEAQRDKIREELFTLEKLFNDARSYSKSVSEEKNVKLEAMRGLFDGSRSLYVHCDYVKQIVAAVNICKQYGMKMVLVGGADAYLVTDLLKANNIPIVLGRQHSLPFRDDDDIDLPYRLPSILKEAGITYALSVEGSWQERNLMFNAGTAAAYGLSREEALEAITSSPAKILGIDQTVGTLTTGKDATLIISDGDILDMRTSQVTHAFIRGKEIDLDNVQTQLYNKYLKKYGIN